ncbi:hypothetical protein XA68_11861 [Ophiocordyceps unilateralis]|uniref:Uncharacterized protein n=1 Tax=Ophiocordyceps unilateralis TaxID=268505 RepID=A0A2A9PFZ0_OPHUN|nr:hypothetical protein XA68_11861 [Ophiocordyceps unilateralis]
MPLRLVVVGRLGPTAASIRLVSPMACRRCMTSQTRPAIPFLSAPTAGRGAGRRFTSARKQWLKHEAKLVVRYTLIFWGCGLAVVVILWAFEQEAKEREFPTPHEWAWRTRNMLRSAHHSGDSDWTYTLTLARRVVMRLGNPAYDGQNVVQLAGRPDPTLEYPDEFIPCDISANSEDWRSGYFDAMLLSAKAAENTDGWLHDRVRNVVVPPKYVLGPSNPRPCPLPPGFSGVPREEDCVLAYPSAENWYMKMLATVGFTPRQRVDAALAYANFLQYKGQSEAAEALYNLALVEATSKMEPARLPYNSKTLVLKEGGEPPSANILEALTAMANFKARKGQLSSALPMYISLLKARRRLPNHPPPPTTSNRPPPSLVQQVMRPPSYPESPGDGTEPPWRNSLERCQEAALHLYIGEILYATSSRVQGLAWTRDAVDLAEEQLQDRNPANMGKEEKTRCRECLAVGLRNWSTIVAQLVQAEKAAKKKSGVESRMIPFWHEAQETPEAGSRWKSEQAVVKERAERARVLLVDDISPQSEGLVSLLKA